MENNYRSYYLYIVFLVLLIFVPPILRLTIPKEDEGINSNASNIKLDTNNYLNCVIIKSNENSLINITIETKYKDLKTSSITFKYINLNNETSKLFLDDYNEMILLKNTYGVKIIDDNTLNFDLIKYNYTNNPIFKDLVKDIDSQEKYYTEMGYTCNKYNIR